MTFIMHQHACAASVIGMEILDLKVVDGDRGFQRFMLDCLDHYIPAVAPDEDVPCAQIDYINPVLLRLMPFSSKRCAARKGAEIFSKCKKPHKTHTKLWYTAICKQEEE